ncbi:hypothetical protein quinque_013523 [Culex quinquefasciatus]
MHHFCRQSSTQAREEYTPTQDATAAAPRARRVAKKGLAAHPVPGDNRSPPFPNPKQGAHFCGSGAVDDSLETTHQQ